jgi:hypothetical protein
MEQLSELPQEQLLAALLIETQKVRMNTAPLVVLGMVAVAAVIAILALLVSGFEIHITSS